MAVISVQAAVASEELGHAEAAVAEALTRIRAASTGSLSELRSMVHLLRTSDAGSDDHRSIRSMSRLPELAQVVEGAGIEVGLTLPEEPLDLPGPVEAAVYRVVQESLTNVVRHASASSASVTVAVAGDDVRVTVTDDGRGSAEASGAGGSGFGLAGMAERVRILGGKLGTSTRPGGGFTVEARIPRRLP